MPSNIKVLRGMFASTRKCKNVHADKQKNTTSMQTKNITYLCNCEVPVRRTAYSQITFVRA